MQDINFLNLEYVFFKIYNFFVNFQVSFWKSIFTEYWVSVKIISYLISLVLFILIIKFYKRLEEVQKKEDESVRSISRPEVVSEEDNRWSNVFKYLESEVEGQWRLAVLEADIILDEYLTKRGYIGENLGEKLKKIGNQGEINPDSLWDAHKVRNMIAHQGFDFTLTHREAKRVVGLYREAMKL